MMKNKYYFFIRMKKYVYSILFFLIAHFSFGQSSFIDNTPGTRSWPVPAGVTSITVEVWGGGGGGQKAAVSSSRGGGGSGGGYVKATYPVTSGSTYAYTIGTGGTGDSGGNGTQTYFIDVNTIKAVGGNGAGAQTTATNPYGVGAAAPTSGNAVGGLAVLVNSTYGGSGASAGTGGGGNNYSGGGGSSAGNGNNNGNNASGSTGGIAPSNGYVGGNGVASGSGVGSVGGIGAGGGGGRRGNSGPNAEVGGAGGSGQIRITYTAVCTGTPAGGTASLSPSTGNPNSTFTASVTGSVTGSAYTYQWQSAPSSTGPWTNIAGATSSGSTTITAVSTVSTTYYRRMVTCTNSGLVDYSSTVSYTTVLTYCKPTSSSPNSLYIREFQFVGTLNNVPANVQAGTAAFSNGYQDYTSLTPAQQPQNAAMNITAKTNGTSGGAWKAWVDWNRDGDFDDAGEEIYRMTGWTTPSITFGFIIPSTALGVYRLRIGTKSSASNFGNCDNFNGGGQDPIYGEYEDYLFEAMVDCPAKVLTINDVHAFDGERCGPGTVRISATGNTSAVDYKWYDSIYGGTLLGTGNTYNTPSISATTTYYVTAVSSTGCETAYRYPVVARIDPQPTVTFSTNKPAICGEDDPTLLVTAAGDKYQDVIFEKFDSGLGAFNNVVADAYTNSLGYWQNKPSPYIPTVAEGYAGTSPAFSSGYFGGNYAIINSDISRSTNVLNYMVSNDLDVSGYINLKLDFDMYHFSIAADTSQGYVKVEYSLDSGTTWNNLTTFFNDVGNPFNWQKFSFDIPGSNFTSTKFKIRFTHFSAAASKVFYEAITTVDNVRVYGYKNITTPFAWSSATTTLYKSDCVTALGSTLESTVCVKPTATELEDVNWALNASATFSNGCPAIGNYTVSNDTKTWLQPSIIDWNLGAQWKPASVPTIAKCVIVRTPVVLPTGSTGTHGLARSVIVKAGGKLTVEPKSSLTIQNYIKNEAAATDVIVESDANLIQNNNAAVNIGDITVRRIANLKRLDYNLWGAPVTGQNVRSFSPGTLDNRFYVYNETNDYFDGLFVHNGYPSPDPFGNIISTTPTENMATYNFVKGLGYGIRASNVLSSTITNVVGEFKGVPNNGIVNVTLNRSPDKEWGDVKKYVHGFNLISNPYPSTIDFDAFIAHGSNSAAIYSTAYFWTNTNFTPKMQGSKYPSDIIGRDIINNYAVLNGTGGVPAPFGFDGTAKLLDVIGSAANCPTCKVPNKYIAPGQGFIVKARNLGNAQVEFDNSIRTNNQTAIFFNRMSVASKSDAKDRFWLNLKTPLDFNTPLLIGYIKGATDNFEEDYDAELMVYAGDSFYSALGDKKLAIQGKQYPFNEKDVIVLGTSFGIEGLYEISIVGKEGVFENGQNVYLKDNLTGMVANLSEGKYAFHANAGDSVDRFEVQYKPANTLDVSNTEKENLKVYQTKNEIVIDSPIKVIGVNIYDASGKLLYTKKQNENKVKINSVFFKSGVYLVEVETSQGKQTKKILK